MKKYNIFILEDTTAPNRTVQNILSLTFRELGLTVGHKFFEDITSLDDIKNIDTAVLIFDYGGASFLGLGNDFTQIRNYTRIIKSISKNIPLVICVTELNMLEFIDDLLPDELQKNGIILFSLSENFEGFLIDFITNKAKQLLEGYYDEFPKYYRRITDVSISKGKVIIKAELVRVTGWDEEFEDEGVFEIPFYEFMKSKKEEDLLKYYVENRGVKNV